ncbi:MAG: enoyl-CoA hydratase-related protein, partial [Pseudomonadota bacterium]
MEFETILAERIGNVLKITLNRPERLNACPPNMAQDIMNALGARGDARAILITGQGRAFCSGADLAAKGDRSISGGVGAYSALTQSYNPLMLTL